MKILSFESVLNIYLYLQINWESIGLQLWISTIHSEAELMCVWVSCLLDNSGFALSVPFF